MARVTVEDCVERVPNRFELVLLAAQRARNLSRGEELTVEFTVLGRPFLGLNGGPNFKPNEAVSFMVLTDDQAETDRYWDAIVGNGGAESQCGWCKDRWGVNWQITPKRLMAFYNDTPARAKAAFEAMMTMKKIDIAALETAADAAG